MALTWKPHQWESAGFNTLEFIHDLGRINPPAPNINYNTYLKCINTALQLLPQDYHEEFFLLLIRLMPHPESAKPVIDYTLNQNLYTYSNAAPVTSRVWAYSLRKIWEPNKNFSILDWVNYYNIPDDKYPPINWNNVSFDKGPHWLSKFVFSRKKDASYIAKIEWLNMLDSLPLSMALDIVIASIHHETFTTNYSEKTLSNWSSYSLEHCLKRMQNADQNVSKDPMSKDIDARLVLNTISFAICNQNIEYDEYLASLMAGPPSTVNALQYFLKDTMWLSPLIHRDEHIDISNWFLRQNDTIKEQIIINLCSNKQFVLSTTSLDVQALFVTFMNRTKCIFSLDSQKAFIRHFPNNQSKYKQSEKMFSLIFPLWNIAKSMSDEPGRWLAEHIESIKLQNETINLHG